ncbi:hypothetical protein FLT15_31630 [Paenibacillus thiaminolyticus]|nr:hypothetical protein [Paenibacillus thiaminolyticus]MDG0871006.1 hypothetical protein [Paenibacillus thiaminolyticus]NGP58829.1 hypothetical protein [Paenibacillus thiaminolyticus]NGP62720.1 hypothetical protein [Paenibacillus thiaminolyticus]
MAKKKKQTRPPQPPPQQKDDRVQVREWVLLVTAIAQLATAVISLLR